VAAVFSTKEDVMDLRYPIGKWEAGNELSPELRIQMIDEIALAPGKIRKAAGGLSDEQLDTPYRPDGWTVRQVIHHLADSHMNAYVRCRLALTEKEPLIKPYDENLWAGLPDARTAPAEISLVLLDSLHNRWARLLRSIRPEDFARTFRHPERGIMTLDATLRIYEWHGRHHTAHITALRQRMGW
jgi:hypothetical protein